MTQFIGSSSLSPLSYLSSKGSSRTQVRLKAKQTFFCQGDAADFVIYLHTGRAKLTVVSARGKEATVSLLSTGDFFGEEALDPLNGLRTSTARTLTPCTALKIDKPEMIRVLREEHPFADIFLKFILSKSIKTQADLVDQLFNSSERRLARTLLLMAEFGSPGDPLALIPYVTQETLAEMVGTTRSRVSFFMNRFRKLGYIQYNRRIRVDKSLLDKVLRDELPGENSAKPKVVTFPSMQVKAIRK